MTKATATGLTQSLNMSLWVLLSCLGTAFSALEDTHSLACNLTVKTRSTPLSVGQCSVDEVPFLRYDDGNKAMPLGDMGKMVNTTSAWKDFIQSLIHIFEELRKQLLNMEPVADKTRDPHILQLITVSQYNGEQFIDAFWKFTIDGQYSFLFYPNNKTWRLTSDEDGGVMKQWEANRELVQVLRKFSMGDSRHYLREFLTYLDMPRLTSRAPNITQITSATEIPPTTQISNNCMITIVTLVILIIFAVAVYKFQMKYCKGDRNCKLCMNSPINCHKPQRTEEPMELSGELPDKATKLLSQEDESKT